MVRRISRGHPPKLRVFLEEQEIPEREFIEYASDLEHILDPNKTFNSKEVMDLIVDFQNRDLEIHSNHDEYGTNY